MVYFNHGQKDDSNLQTNTANPFIDGELVRLYGFKRKGNTGVFHTHYCISAEKLCRTCRYYVRQILGVIVMQICMSRTTNRSLSPSNHNRQYVKYHFHCIPRINVQFANGEIILSGPSNKMLSHIFCCDSCHSTPGCSGWSFRKAQLPALRHGECTLCSGL